VLLEGFGLLINIKFLTLPNSLGRGPTEGAKFLVDDLVVGYIATEPSNQSDIV